MATARQDRADALWQIEMIHQLKARYFRAVDSKEWDLLATVFTTDAVLEVAGNTRSGRGEIISVMSTRLAGFDTVHHGHMPEITLTGVDHATGIWAMNDVLVDRASGERREGYGHYYERYLLLDGLWRIQHLRLVRIDLAGQS